MSQAAEARMFQTFSICFLSQVSCWVIAYAEGCQKKQGMFLSCVSWEPFSFHKTHLSRIQLVLTEWMYIHRLTLLFMQ